MTKVIKYIIFRLLSDPWSFGRLGSTDLFKNEISKKFPKQYCFNRNLQKTWKKWSIEPDRSNLFFFLYFCRGLLFYFHIGCISTVWFELFTLDTVCTALLIQVKQILFYKYARVATPFACSPRFLAGLGVPGLLRLSSTLPLGDRLSRRSFKFDLINAPELR